MVRMADLSRSQGQKLTWMISYYAGRVEVPCVQEIDPNTSTHMTMVDCLVYTQVSAHPGHVTPISCHPISCKASFIYLFQCFKTQGLN